MKARVLALMAVVAMAPTPALGIRCVIDTENDPAEISLDENLTREDLHPADQFERFRELTEDRGWDRNRNRTKSRLRHLLSRFPRCLHRAVAL
jgi:hypothetical protein